MKLHDFEWATITRGWFDQAYADIDRAWQAATCQHEWSQQPSGATVNMVCRKCGTMLGSAAKPKPKPPKPRPR